jgi:hypothetical protein
LLYLLNLINWLNRFYDYLLFTFNFRVILLLLLILLNGCLVRLWFFRLNILIVIRGGIMIWCVGIFVLNSSIMLQLNFLRKLILLKGSRLVDVLLGRVSFDLLFYCYINVFAIGLRVIIGP